MRAESAYLCLGRPPLGVWTHMGWLSFAKWGTWLSVWKHRVGTRSGWEAGWGKVACSGCTAVLVFVTSRRAAVESGPEFSLGGGSRELFPRGQQWDGGSSVCCGAGHIFLTLLLLSLFLFLLFLQLTSLLLFLSHGTLLSCSCCLLHPKMWPAKVVAGCREVRAAAAPWWHPGPCALWPLSLTPADSTGCSCRRAGDAFQETKPKAKETAVCQS